MHFPPYFIEIGHSIPSALPEEKLAQAFDVMKRAIRAVGITRGAAKADIRITNRGAVIGEITARLSGGFHSQYTDPLATGMSAGHTYGGHHCFGARAKHAEHVDRGKVPTHQFGQFHFILV